jgi:hypothetical protein
VTRRGWNGVSFRIEEIGLDFGCNQGRRTLRGKGKAAMISRLNQHQDPRY